MKGILINYEYCTGCHSCEVACRNELGLTHGEYGIKLTEVGPFEYKTPINADTKYEWVFNPTITKACDLCAARTAVGKMPSCVQACQAWCMYYGELEDLIKKMDGKTRYALYSAIDPDKVADLKANPCIYDKSDMRRAGGGDLAAESTEIEAAPINIDEDSVVNMEITNEATFEAFIAENATIDYEAAKADLQAQFIANSKANKYVLAAENAKDGAEVEIKYQGISMSYDAQGTQLGGGKAYLDKGQAVARVDITIIF